MFVYGTLRRGEVRDINALKPAPTFVMQGTVLGTLFNLGKYPGLVLGQGSPVLGEVYAIADELETVLDAIEGIGPNPRDEYAKRTVEVLSAKERYACLVYEVNPSCLPGKERIHHGDWVRYRLQALE